MITAIINRQDIKSVCTALVENKIMFTKIGSTGGFLRKGNATLIIGTDDSKVNDIIEIIKKHSAQRMAPFPIVPDSVNSLHHKDEDNIPQVIIGGATIFVTDVSQYEKF